MSTTTKTTASPTKLRSGDWGAKVKGLVCEGDIITIRTKAGKSWDAKVAKVIWTGKDKFTGGEVSIVATCAADYTPAKRDSRGYVTERGHAEGYCGFPCPVSGRKCCPANGPCHDCI